jgi:flagellar capping protein FliD
MEGAMSDVYLPGVKSRFNSEKIIEDLMKIERLPKERVEKNIESLETNKGWWQNLGRRITSLRDSARMLYMSRNPFNERTAFSSNEKIITAAATREADEQEYQFTIKQLAQGDRFLSSPLDDKMQIEKGTYTFTLGESETSINFKGGTLREFVDVLNRQGRGKISASFMTVQPGTRSLLIESKLTGADNRLTFSDNVAALAESFKPISEAQDAIIEMVGIEMTRPTNVINDVIPGVTITAKGVSNGPETIEIRPDRDGVKDAIISLVGNYNRLMAELNVLTRADDRLIDELTYLDKDEIAEMRQRLGAFSGDTSLNQLRSNLLRAISSPYSTDDDYDITLLAQIGISTNIRDSGGAGYNPSRLRGYLEIDEKALDAAIEQNLPAIRQLFASSTTGDIIADTGVAVNLDTLAKPFVEVGGIIALKTGTIDSKISQDKRRVDTMERQLAQKEADLKIQYSRMESAYDRMEKMSSSLDGFSQRNNNNR